MLFRPVSAWGVVMLPIAAGLLPAREAIVAPE